MPSNQQEHGEPTGGKDVSRMAQKKRKRPYGSGCLLKVKTGWAIRWREQKDGKRVMKYEALGDIPKLKASQILSDKVREASKRNADRQEAPVSFNEHAARWEKDILPLYKFSTRKGHQWILNTHLLPRFGAMMLTAFTMQEIQ